MIGKDKIVLVVDKIMEYFLYGLIFFIPISKAAIESFVTLLLLLFLAKKFLKPDFRFLRNPLHLSLLFFVLFTTLSLLNSGPYLKKSFLALFFKWSEYIFIFLITQDVFFNRRRIRNTIFIFSCAAFLVSFDGLFQFFVKTDFLRQRELVCVANHLYALTASFQHYNDFGTYLVISFVVVTSLLLKEQKKAIYEIFLWVTLMFIEICLVLTFSRGSWLNLFVASALILLLSKKAKKMLPMLTIFIIMFITMPLVKDRIMFSFHPQGDADRFLVWKTAFKMIKENPFLGKGVGTFMDYFHAYVKDKVVQYAHNCFLQIWAETGIFSLISFLSFLGFLLWGAIAAFRKNRNLIILGIAAGLSGFLVHSFFDTHFYSLQLSVLFWTMAGVLQALVNIETTNNKGEI